MDNIIIFICGLFIALIIYAYNADKKHMEYRLEELEEKIKDKP